MDGQNATMTIAPVAVGAQIDARVYDSTATGLFHVYSKTADLTYDAPYHTYISNWVGFDPKLDNGLHSFLEDKNGKVVDASTGGVSNGCIRTGGKEAKLPFEPRGDRPVYCNDCFQSQPRSGGGGSSYGGSSGGGGGYGGDRGGGGGSRGGGGGGGRRW